MQQNIIIMRYCGINKNNSDTARLGGRRQRWRWWRGNHIFPNIAFVHWNSEKTKSIDFALWMKKRIKIIIIINKNSRYLNKWKIKERRKKKLLKTTYHIRTNFGTWTKNKFTLLIICEFFTSQTRIGGRGFDHVTFWLV